MAKQEGEPNNIENSKKYAHYSNKGGHHSRGAFSRHIREVYTTFGIDMRGVPSDYDNGWSKRRLMRRIPRDGRY